MADTSRATSPANGSVDSDPAIQDVIAERDRLRAEVSGLRREVLQLRCQAEMLREEWFMARSQEQEYRQYVKKLTGFDPHVFPQEVLDAE